jgi:hypothetical protein
MCGDWRDNKGKRGRQGAKKNRREMKVNVSEDDLRCYQGQTHVIKLGRIFYPFRLVSFLDDQIVK